MGPTKRLDEAADKASTNASEGRRDCGRAHPSAVDDEEQWSTMEVHRRLVNLNINSSTSSGSTSERKSSSEGKTPTESGSSSWGASAGSGTPTGVLQTRMTSKAKVGEVTVGQQRFDALNQYILIKDLGRGSHSKVQLAMNQYDNVLYAVKWTDARVGSRKATRKEIAVLKKLHHPNIRTLHEVIDDEGKTELILVLEYCEVGPVFTRYNKVPLTEDVLLGYAKDIVLGLDYLHSLNIAHMDLKPENMLKCADGSVKLADFGVSFIHDLVSSSGVENRLVGTPAFLAPEVLSEDGYDPFKADIWSLGVCLYNMATAKLPFLGKTVYQIVNKARSTELSFPEDVRLSSDLMDLLRRMLCVDPEKRIEIAGIMHHSWVTEGGTKPLARPLTELPHTVVEVTEEEIAGAIRTDPLSALLQPAFSRVEFKDGDILMRKGAIGEVMYFINKGECEVLMDAVGVDLDTINPETDSDVLVVRIAGEIVGEIAFLKAMEGIRERRTDVHGYRTATVRAKGPVECLAVTIKDMMQALGKDETSRVRLVRSASFKLDQNEEVRLQLSTARRSIDSERSEDAEEQVVPFRPTREIKVLYAEDSMPTQMIVKAFFRKMGNVKVEIASDGKKALDAVAHPNSDFDLILMDCQMPVMDGLESTRQIRKLDSHKATIPIVGVSSGIQGMDEKECLDVGMNDFALKPLNVHMLETVVRKNLPALFSEANTNEE
jgi:[calcium/calmodulin-dependent protein kinase] kinase